MIVTKRTILNALLGTMTGVGGALNGAKVHLYKTNVALSPDLDVGAFTEADFTGYAASSAITWGSPGYDVNNVPEVFGDMKTFNAGTPITVTNQVYGYFVTDGAGTALLYAEAFAGPVAVINADQMLAVIPRVSAGQFVS